MTNELPTIDIKGKKYVLVSERVLAFNDTYKSGAINTEILSQVGEKNIVVKATVTPDTANPLRRFVGHSQATVGEGMVNQTAALENAETSAVGRALGMMGIGVIESIASADEMNKAMTSKPTPIKEEKGVPAPMCAIHNVAMVKRVGQYGTFFSCPEKDENGNWCKYKPMHKPAMVGDAATFGGREEEIPNYE